MSSGEKLGARATKERQSLWRFLNPFYYLSALIKLCKSLPSKAWEGIRWGIHYLALFILFLLFLIPNLLVFTACFIPARWELTEGMVPQWHDRFSVFWNYLELSDDIWHLYDSVTRQGLQYFGALCGLLFATLHTEMLVRSLLNDEVEKYHHNVTRDLSHVLEDYASDNKCAYFTGTGIPLQGYGDEPLAWYAAYHIALVLMSVMLILDEVTNVRVGLFAPQWTRAGNGWTLIYLMSATLSHSSNYGPKGLNLFRYYLLTIIVLIGAVFNLLRGICASLRWGPAHWRRESHRIERFALKPWRGVNHPDSFEKSNKPHELNHEDLYWTDKLAIAIGEGAPELSRFKVKRSKEEIEAHPKRRSFTEALRQRTAAQHKSDRGYSSKKLWRGYRIDLPLLTPEQTRAKNGNPWKAIINWVPVWNANGKTAFSTIKAGQEMNKSILQWFDFRRYLAISAGLCLFTVQLFLSIHDLNYMARNMYNEQFDEVARQWKENLGPRDDKCGYFEFSAVPINVLPGSSAWTCVRSSLAWSGIHHTMLMGMCVAVVLVAWTNNRFWGMHVSFLPISLIGCRLSSNSIGVTLQLVSYATMSQSMFFTNYSLFWCARFATYWALGVGYLFFLPNERMRNRIIRNPFPGKYLVIWGYQFMGRLRMGRGEDEDDDD